MRIQAHIKRTLLHAALFFASIFIALCADAQEHVTFKGKVHVPTNGRPMVALSVTNGTDTMQVMAGRNGRFEFDLPFNEKQLLVVECAGYIKKEVILDTRLAAKHETIVFYVELEINDPIDPLIYAGPVGEVRFAKRSGHGRATYAHLKQALVPAASMELIAKQ